MVYLTGRSPRQILEPVLSRKAVQMSSKIVICGAGGVGGYFGARLAAVGNDVTFVARGAHFEAMRSNGLRVLSPLGDISLPEVEVVDSVDQIKRADFVSNGQALGHRASSSISRPVGGRRRGDHLFSERSSEGRSTVEGSS